MYRYLYLIYSTYNFILLYFYFECRTYACTAVYYIGIFTFTLTCILLLLGGSSTSNKHKINIAL